MARVTSDAKMLARIGRALRRYPVRYPRRTRFLLGLVRLLEGQADLASGRRPIVRISRPEEEPREDVTTTPEDTLREAGVSSRRQATYQRKFSTLLAGKDGI